MTNPTPQQIRAARLAGDLTQAAAAELIYCKPRAWMDWETGTRNMHPAFFELFKRKTQPGAIP